MSTYANTYLKCGDSYETECWEPAKCPFCELNELQGQLSETRAALQLAYTVLVTLETDGMNDKDYAEAIIEIEKSLNIPQNERIS